MPRGGWGAVCFWVLIGLLIGLAFSGWINPPLAG